MVNTNATEKITAQNSRNQSKMFGVFNESELAYIVDSHNSEQRSNGELTMFNSSFVINCVKQAENLLDKARMNNQQKEFIKGAIGMLISLGKYESRESFDTELVFQSDSPEDIRFRLEDEEGKETLDDIAEDVRYELDCLMVDISEMEEYNCDGFFNDSIEEYVSAVEEFVDIAEEYGLDLGDERLSLCHSLIDKYLK